MDICFNVEEEDQKDGYTSLVYKGVLNSRRKKVKQLAQDKRVPMLFFKNAWVDTEVAIELAYDFAKHARNKHNNAWILLYLGKYFLLLSVSNI